MYDDKFFKDITFKTKWKPGVDFHNEIFSLFVDLAMADHGWYYQSKRTDKWKGAITAVSYTHLRAHET